MTDHKNFDEKKKALDEEALDEVAGGKFVLAGLNTGAKKVPEPEILKTIKVYKKTLHKEQVLCTINNQMCTKRLFFFAN